jgi:hypothetical protein
MDLFMLILGVSLTIFGSALKKNLSNTISVIGMLVLTIGIAITFVGALWFSLGFMHGWNE